MSKKKLSFLIIQPWLAYGGAEAVSVQLAYNLVKKGYGAKVIALYKEKKLPHLSDKVDIVVLPKPFSTLFSKSKLFLLLFGLPALILLVFS